MRHINAKTIAFTATTLKNINFILAHINELYIARSHIIGDRLNFQYATITKGCILGEIIPRLHKKEKRTNGVMEEDEPLGEGICIATGGIIGMAGGAFFYGIGAFPGAYAGMATGGVGYAKVSDYMQWYGTSNINSILLNTDFHAAKLKDVYFSNLKFGNCSNISTSKFAIGCLFENVVSSDKQDIKHFLDKGAKISTSELPLSIERPKEEDFDCKEEYLTHLECYLEFYKALQAHGKDKYNTSFNFIWKKTKYDSYMKQLVTSMTQGFIFGLLSRI